MSVTEKTPAEIYFSVAEAITKCAADGTLKKAILSKPNDKTVIRTVLTGKMLSGKAVVQAETFKSDNKAIHKNLSLADSNVTESVSVLAQDFSQINIISSAGECELRRSKNGKITVKGLAKLMQYTPTEIKASESENNRKKQYILDGSESFLKLLGVSDENGRVYDKKQSKFRQINRFLEHIRDITKYLPADGELFILDLCCGKSYLSFAVYHYFANVLKRDVTMHGVDLKPDVISYCAETSEKLGYDGLTFICGDISQYTPPKHPNLVVSLHACDTATDIVIDKAIAEDAEVILSTPCCHHELNHKLDCPTLDFIAEHSMLRQKFCDAATDALRLMRMKMNGYSADALELIDPEDTPKNILLRGIKKKGFDKSSPKALELAKEYEETRAFLYGKNA